MDINNVTAVVVNWLTERRTLGAIESFRKFYPDMKLIIVDDDSQEEDKSEFFSAYNGHNVNPHLEYDPGVEKLKAVENATFLQMPRHPHHPKSEGHSVDLAMQNMETEWMFHFHSDYRFTKPGSLELLMSKVEDGVCAVGNGKTKHPELLALSGVIELINVKLGKEHGLSYKPVIYHLDKTTTPFPGDAGDGMPIAAGGYYTGKLSQLGYKVVGLGGLHEKFGVHMRWEGDLEKWNLLY